MKRICKFIPGDDEPAKQLRWRRMAHKVALHEADVSLERDIRRVVDQSSLSYEKTYGLYLTESKLDVLSKALTYLKDAKAELRKELAGAVYACTGTRISNDTDASPDGYGFKAMQVRKSEANGMKAKMKLKRAHSDLKILEHRQQAIESGKLQQNFDQEEKERKFGKGKNLEEMK